MRHSMQLLAGSLGFLFLATVAGADLRIPPGTPTTPALQEVLERIDRELGESLGIPADRRACGVVDLDWDRHALVRGDAIFYGASVPKICILAAYFEKFPAAVEKMDAGTRSELELMIKRSSNEMAAKYSRLVGLDRIQAFQESGKYRLYDAESGGGLWSGKHYGSPEPRTVEPVGGFSHAFTVRQALRFFLMLEQGRLVSAKASQVMRGIFEAPTLNFHDDNFVAGLKGRPVSMIRKNGLWEDWHLDVASIEHEGRRYLIAAAARHERGPEYLAGLASRMDDHLVVELEEISRRSSVHIFDDTGEWKACEIRGGRVDAGRNAVVLVAGEARESSSGHFGEVVTTELSDARHPFDELLPSWNVSITGGEATCVFELRVRRPGETEWSPYLHVGDWSQGPAILPDDLVTECAHGKIHTDYFASKELHDRAQIRMRAFAPPKSQVQVELRRLALCVSKRSEESPWPRFAGSQPPFRGNWKRRLTVPFRSQKVERAEIAGRICSPTSVAMLLAYRGKPVKTGPLAELIYDRAHDIYGNWPRAIQGAFTHGVPGYLARFSDWTHVKQSIAGGHPLIISIAVKEGQLPGGSYEKTAGHLLVLTGFDGHGGVHVNDPAASTPEQGITTYRMKDLDVVWMQRGGTAYVIGR